MEVQFRKHKGFNRKGQAETLFLEVEEGGVLLEEEYHLVDEDEYREGDVDRIEITKDGPFGVELYFKPGADIGKKILPGAKTVDDVLSLFPEKREIKKQILTHFE